MRVLATTFPAWGHVVPMLGVMRALQDAGHEIHVATHPDFHPMLKHLSFDVLAAGFNENDLMAERLRRWPHTAHEPPGRWAARMFTEIAGPRMAADLEGLTVSARPDLVLSEEGENGGPTFAAARGIACVRHGWGTPPAPGPPTHQTLLAHIDPCPPTLNPNPWNGPPRWPVRIAAPRIAPQNPRVTAWLAGRTRPVAYVSFGTVPLYAPAPRLVHRLIQALRTSGLDVLTTTRDTLPWTDDRVHTTPFLELSDVLPACDLVVCHGGAGTVLAALAHGLPLLISPRGAPSQQRMATAAAAAGTAAIVPPGTVDIAALIDTTRSTEQRRHARDVCREIAAAPHPDKIAHQLGDLAG